MFLVVAASAGCSSDGGSASTRSTASIEPATARQTFDAGTNLLGLIPGHDLADQYVIVGAPRRSVIIALWDAEEDGLLGSAAFVANPVVPPAQTVAYVNFDIQGTNISPSLRDLTVLIGAETGGPNLVKFADIGAEASTTPRWPG